MGTSRGGAATGDVDIPWRRGAGDVGTRKFAADTVVLSTGRQRTHASSSSRYAFAGQLALYKLANGAFAAASPEPRLGCVVLGGNVLIYDSAKKHVCAAAAAEVAASCVRRA